MIRGENDGGWRDSKKENKSRYKTDGVKSDRTGVKKIHYFRGG